jgi:hypothetical protein
MGLGLWGHCTSAAKQRKQGSVFLTEEQGRTIEFTEEVSVLALRAPFGQIPREAPCLAFSLGLVVLPCSSVVKTLSCLLIAGPMHVTAPSDGLSLHAAASWA